MAAMLIVSSAFGSIPSVSAVHADGSLIVALAIASNSGAATVVRDTLNVLDPPATPHGTRTRYIVQTLDDMSAGTSGSSAPLLSAPRAAPGAQCFAA